jgi:Tfp pilus assembly protein PilX
MEKTVATRADRGSALLLAVVVFIMIAGAGAALFSLSLKGHQTTLGASNGDLAFHIAEGGIDDTLNKLNAYAAKPSQTADYAVIGTKSSYGGVTCNLVTGKLNQGSYVALVEPPYAGLGTYKLTSVATYSDTKRAIETYVVAENAGGSFAYGLFGDVTLDAGGTLFTDGYKSGLGTYASQLAASANTFKGTKYVNATGHIGSNGGVDVSGSAMVVGNATPGPGYTVTGGGSVAGSKTPATSAYALTPVDYTPTVALSASLPSSTLNGGEYRIASLSMVNKQKLTIKGDVTLFVDGDIKITAQSQVFIEKGASLTIIQGGGSLTVNGGADVNTNGGVGVGSGLPADFTIKSKTTNAKINGTSSFFGVVYAPGADITLNGTADYHGSVVGKTIKPTGTAKFHYDEDLGAVSAPSIVFKVKSSRQYVP